jgi:hypothetical protein
MDPLHQSLVDLPDEAKADRKPSSHAGQPVIHGGDVVRGLADVLERDTRCDVVLV